MGGQSQAFNTRGQAHALGIFNVRLPVDVGPSWRASRWRIQRAGASGDSGGRGDKRGGDRCVVGGGCKRDRGQPRARGWIA